MTFMDGARYLTDVPSVVTFLITVVKIMEIITYINNTDSDILGRCMILHKAITSYNIISYITNSGYQHQEETVLYKLQTPKLPTRIYYVNKLNNFTREMTIKFVTRILLV